MDCTIEAWGGSREEAGGAVSMWGVIGYGLGTGMVGGVGWC